jgi:hypothetical protein
VWSKNHHIHIHVGVCMWILVCIYLHIYGQGKINLNTCIYIYECACSLSENKICSFCIFIIPFLRMNPEHLFILSRPLESGSSATYKRHFLTTVSRSESAPATSTQYQGKAFLHSGYCRPLKF